MPGSSGLSHVAMSVPVGALTDEYRTLLLDFFGGLLGWHEIESLRLPDRLTVAIGSSSYINLRERPESTTFHDYEHFGVLVSSAEAFQQVWTDLASGQLDVQLEPLTTNEDGEGSFRFRYLLPMAVEVQYFERLLGRRSRQ